jgi:hypothetical protein
MTKVKMLKNYRVAVDCRTNTTYLNGEVYDISDEETLNNMIHDGVVELVEDKPTPKQPVEENKAIEKAPENKSQGKKKKK